MTIPHTGRTIIGSVVFLDIVAYTKSSDRHQLAMKTALNDAVAQALEGIAENERIILDTGDGCAICFLGDPEDAMYVAGAIRLESGSFTGPAEQILRIGINLGPLRIISDLSGRPNVVGDGINVAQRIMSFAGEGEVLVSRSYYEVVSCLSDDNKRLFQQLGILKDKHIREHQVYALNLSSPDPAAHPTTPAAQSYFSGEEEGRIADAEAKLTELIGPLANVIGERARKASTSYAAAIDQMAAAVVDEGDRAAFLETARADMPAAAAGSAGRPAAEVATAPLDPAACDVVERHFAHHMGPLAAVLVEKLKADCMTIDGLSEKLATYIDNEDARQRFLSTIREDEALH